jgi:branched-chain amino acid transport system substrate-binding protein
MFRRSKKVLAAVAAGALALGLAACSAPAPDNGGDAGGDAPSSVTIGFVGSLTGPLAASGINSLAGLKAGAEYAETLHEGLTVEVVERDTAGEATAAVAQTRELAQLGATAIFFTTEAFPAVQGVLNQVKIPGATSGGIAAVLADVGDSRLYKYAFATSAGNAGPTSITPLLDYASSFGDKIGIIEDASAFAVAQADQTQKLAAADYPDLEMIRVSFPATASDATAQLSQLRDADVDAVISWPYGTPAVTIMNSFDKLGWYPPVATVLGVGTPAIIEVIPDELTENLSAGPIANTFLEGAEDPDGLHAEFVTRYLEALDKDAFTGLDTVGANSFDWALLIAQAVLDENTTDGDAIKNYLTSGAEFVGVNGTYTFGPDKRIGIPAEQLGMYKPKSPCSIEGYCVPSE